MYVLCKDCKYYVQEKKLCIHPKRQNIYTGFGYVTNVSDEDYCLVGENNEREDTAKES